MKLKYSLEVYEDYAIINGWLTTDMLTLIVRLCKKEGFTHLTNNGDKLGFNLVRKNDKSS